MSEYQNPRGSLTPRKMELFLKAMSVTSKAHYKWTGDQTLKEFVVVNPTWTSKMWKAIVVENIDYLRKYSNVVRS